MRASLALPSPGCARQKPLVDALVLAEFLPQITAPVTIINGRDDRVVPVANAEFLDQRLPNSRLEIVDAGHFVWEEAPQPYASTVSYSV